MPERPWLQCLRGTARPGWWFEVSTARASSGPSRHTGLLARAFQHEIDHLDGTLFIDRLRGIKRDLIVRRIQKLKRSGKW